MQRISFAYINILFMTILLLTLLGSFFGALVVNSTILSTEYFFIIKFIKTIAGFSLLLYWHLIRQSSFSQDGEMWFKNWQVGAILLIQALDGLVFLLVANEQQNIISVLNLGLTGIFIFSLNKYFIAKRIADFWVVLIVIFIFTSLISYFLNGNVNVVNFIELPWQLILVALTGFSVVVSISILRLQSLSKQSFELELVPLLIVLAAGFEFIGEQQYWLWWTSNIYELLLVFSLIAVVVRINRKLSMDWLMLESGLAQSEHPYFYADTSGDIRFVNSAYRAFFEYSKNRPLSRIKSPFYTHPLQESINSALNKDGYWKGETVLVTHTGIVHSVFMNLSVVDIDGISYQQGWFENIQEKKVFKKNEHVMLEKLEHLSLSLIEKQEEERSFFAKELHDEIGQGLTLVKIQQQLPEPDKELIKTVLSELIDKVRNMSLNLRPAILDDMGLSAALSWLVDRQQKFTLLSISSSIQQDLPRLDDKLEISVFRIAQEAFTNIHKYSHADQVTIKCFVESGYLHLTIEDNGVGFDIDAKLSRANQGQSLGLLSLKERAFLIKGVVEIFSTPENGTKINLIAPLYENNYSSSTGRHDEETGDNSIEH